MNKLSLTMFNNEYLSFIKKLSEDINNNSIYEEPHDCYLIEESWHIKLLDYFKDNEIQKNKDESNYINLLKKNIPEVINDFSSIINCIKKEKNFKIINKQLIESLYEKTELLSNNYVKYYSGNKKLIIEFKDNNNSNKAILLLNPFEENNKKIFIILFKHDDNKKYFEELLLQKNEFYFELEKKYNGDNIIPFNVYINLLKLFIDIFNYEKSFSENKNNIVNKDNYYIINSNWLNNFKKYFNYNKFIEQNEEIIKANLNNYDNYFNTSITDKININFEIRKSFIDEIINIEKINPKIEEFNGNIKYIKKGYFINSHVLELFKNIFNNININIEIKNENIFFKNNYFYLLYQRKSLLEI